jgi:hypothetical protein
MVSEYNTDLFLSFMRMFLNGRLLSWLDIFCIIKYCLGIYMKSMSLNAPNVHTLKFSVSVFEIGMTKYIS